MTSNTREIVHCIIINNSVDVCRSCGCRSSTVEHEYQKDSTTQYVAIKYLPFSVEKKLEKIFYWSIYFAEYKRVVRQIYRS